MNETTQIKGNTKYFCIKSVIRKACENFINNKDSFSFAGELKWDHPTDRIDGTIYLIIFREDIYKFIDVENTTIEKFNKMRLTKQHYLQIWRAIK